MNLLNDHLYSTDSPKFDTINYGVSSEFKQKLILEPHYFTRVLKCDWETSVLSYFTHLKIGAMIPIQITYIVPS